MNYSTLIKYECMYQLWLLTSNRVTCPHTFSYLILNFFLYFTLSCSLPVLMLNSFLSQTPQPWVLKKLKEPNSHDSPSLRSSLSSTSVHTYTHTSPQTASNAHSPSGTSIVHNKLTQPVQLCYHAHACILKWMRVSHDDPRSRSDVEFKVQ